MAVSEVLGSTVESQEATAPAAITDVSNKAREQAYGAVVDMVLQQRQQAKAEKNWALSDKIRDDLAQLGFEVKDTKDGFAWTLNK